MTAGNGVLGESWVAAVAYQQKDGPGAITGFLRLTLKLVNTRSLSFREDAQRNVAERIYES
jgi:hypothetical protein